MQSQGAWRSTTLTLTLAASMLCAGCAPVELQRDIPAATNTSPPTWTPRPTVMVASTPTQTVAPTETATRLPTPSPEPTEIPAPEVRGNYQENLVPVVQGDGERIEEVELTQDQPLAVEEVNSLIGRIGEVNKRGENKFEIFVEEGLVSSGVAITEKAEKGEEGTFDVRGEVLSAPESLQFVEESQDGEEKADTWTLVEEKSNEGAAVYINSEREKKLVPLQFSLVGIPLADREIIGAVPYRIEGEESIRLAFITQNDNQETDYLVGFSSIEPFVLNSTQRLLEKESLELDREGNLVIQNEGGNVIQRYNPDRGEWNLIVPELELAGEKVDWKWETQGQFQGIPYNLKLGADFCNRAYRRIPIKNAEVKNEELLGQMIMWVHYRNWVMSEAISATGGINYWRNKYKSGDRWQKAEEVDMQKFVDSAKSLIEQHSFEDYINRVQAGGGHYYVFGKNDQGVYDFHQVSPQRSFTFVRKESTDSGVKELHPGHPYSHEIKVTREGGLIAVLGIEAFYNEFLLGQSQTDLEFLSKPEHKDKFSEQELARIRKVVFETSPGGALLARMNHAYIPPTFTPQSLHGDAMQVYPEGRIFVNNFPKIRNPEFELAKAGMPYFFVLRGEEDIDNLDYPLKVELSEILSKELSEIWLP